MSSELKVRKRRNFGDILTDPFKLIFRNLKSIFVFNLMYIFLPLVIGMGGITFIQFQYIKTGNFPVLVTIIAGICLFISGINIFASTYAIVKTADQKGFEDIEYQDIQQHFFNKYTRNLLFVLVVSIVGAVLMGLVGLSALISPVILVILAVISAFIVILYVYPMLYLASNIYLFEKRMDIAESFGKAREYLSENWGLVFSTFMVASVIYSFLSYTFAIPFALIGLLLMDFSEFATGQTDTALAFSMVQQTVSAFFTSFLFQYIGICMYFKYFDLEEKQYGFNLLERIQQIGETKNSYFENEGEF